MINEPCAHNSIWCCSCCRASRPNVFFSHKDDQMVLYIFFRNDCIVNLVSCFVEKGEGKEGMGSEIGTIELYFEPFFHSFIRHSRQVCHYRLFILLLCLLVLFNFCLDCCERLLCHPRNGDSAMERKSISFLSLPLSLPLSLSLSLSVSVCLSVCMSA